MSGKTPRPQNKKKNPKGEGKRLRKLLPVFCFTLICYIVCVLLCAVLLLLSDHGGSPFPYAVFALGVAAFLSAYFAARLNKKNGMLTGFLTTLPMHLAILLLSLFLGGFEADLTLLFTFAILSLLSMIGGVLAVNRSGKPKVHQKPRKPGRAS